MPKILTQAETEQFWNQGYCFPFDCLTAEEAAEARARFEAFEAEIDDDIHKHLRVKVHLGFMWLWELAHHPKILRRGRGPDRAQHPALSVDAVVQERRRRQAGLLASGFRLLRARTA